VHGHSTSGELWLFTVQVVAHIVGEQPLPWEHAARVKQLLKTAGHYRAPLLTLLRRDPQERPSIRSFLSYCSSLASSTTKERA
jgi:hypothetical protein